MKKTITILTIAGIITTGFMATNIKAEVSPSESKIEVADKELTKEMNRLEGALALADALEIEPVSPTYHFDDVPSEHQGIINALVASDIAGPMADTHFGSEEPLDRGETAIWINYGFDLPSAEQSYDFTDVNALCTQDVANVVGNGIIEPTGYDATFGMRESVTTEQLSLYLERASLMSK